MIEFVLKLIVMGPYGYFGDTYNCFDFVLIIFSILDLALQASLAGAKALRVLRLFRMARGAQPHQATCILL